MQIESSFFLIEITHRKLAKTKFDFHEKGSVPFIRLPSTNYIDPAALINLKGKKSWLII